MPFIPADDVLQVEFLITCNGQRVENVVHYYADAAWTITDMTAFGTPLVTWWVNNIRPLVHTGTSLRAIRMTDMRAAIAPVIEFNTGLPSVGSGAGASLPNSVSTVITKRTTLRGRSYRGRIYTYGMMETQMDGDAINPAVTTSYINAWNAALTFTVGAITWNMVVLSRYANNAPRANGEHTAVLNFTSDGIVDSQRRRLSGRGN